ncbi:MAG: hypothetical protein WCT31_01740 [Candidatus Micrarchaeia archaeon]
MPIKIETNKEEYFPGDNLHVRFNLIFQKPVKARAIIATLVCSEKIKKIEYRSIPYDEKKRMEELGVVVTSPVKPVEVFRDSESFRAEKKIAGQGEYADQGLETFFEIPQNAHPTSRMYGHDDRITAWKLHVKIDISMSPDINAEKEIIVGGL